MSTPTLPIPVSEPDLLDPEDLMDDGATDPSPQSRRFATGFAIFGGALLLFFLLFNVVLPREIFRDANITIGEAEQLRASLGIVEAAMKVEERLGNTVLREADPPIPPADPFGQTLKLTVKTPGGAETVYRMRYALEHVPGLEGDRVLMLHPLNQAAQELLDTWHIAYLTPAAPLPEE